MFCHRTIRQDHENICVRLLSCYHKMLYVFYDCVKFIAWRWLFWHDILRNTLMLVAMYTFYEFFKHNFVGIMSLVLCWVGNTRHLGLLWFPIGFHMGICICLGFRVDASEMKIIRISPDFHFFCCFSPEFFFFPSNFPGIPFFLMII